LSRLQLKQIEETEARIQSSPQSQNGPFVNPNGVSTKLFSQETWEVPKEYIFGKRIDPKPLIDLPIHRLHPEEWEKHQAGQFFFLDRTFQHFNFDGKPTDFS